MQLNITSFIASSSNPISTNGTLSNLFFLGNDDSFIPFSSNVLVKKIRVNFSPGSPTSGNWIKSWSIRLNAINRDGLPLVGQQGEIINATSGVFNQFPIKSNVLRLNFNSLEPELNWKDGIMIGGIDFNVFSYEFYNTNPITTTSKLLCVVNIFWQFPE